MKHLLAWAVAVLLAVWIALAVAEPVWLLVFGWSAWWYVTEALLICLAFSLARKGDFSFRPVVPMFLAAAFLFAAPAHANTLTDRIVDSYRAAKYPGIAQEYRMQIEAADAMRKRRLWSVEYRTLRRRAFALIQGRDVATTGRWSDAIDTIAAMKDEQRKVRP